MTQTKKRMYEVRRGPAERMAGGAVYHIMAFTGEQAIEEIAVDFLGQDADLDEIKSRASTHVATEVVQHPETGEWVPVDWREKRIAEIESQVEDLMAELKKLGYFPFTGACLVSAFNMGALSAWADLRLAAAPRSVIREDE